jgi:hypothetical protein
MKMSHRKMNFGVTVLAALALAMPIAAHDNKANAPKTAAHDTTSEIRTPLKATMELFHPATLAGKQLKPGTYRVVVDASKATLSLDGKVVAEAPVEWKDGEAKSPYSALVLDGQAISEIHFSGKAKYAAISQ